MIEIPSFTVEEQFSLAGTASHDSAVIDTRDWGGSRQADFTVNREFGWPLLDLTIRPPGNCNVIIRYAVPTFPIAEPPALVFSDVLTVAVAGGTWGEVQGRRLTARFARVRVTDTSGVANNDIYLHWAVRSQ